MNPEMAAPAVEAIPPNGDAEALWTIQRILQWSTEFLKAKGSPSARLDAEILMAYALGLNRLQLYTSYDKPVFEHERGPLRDYLRRRGAGEPVAYITGQKEFMGHNFVVSPAVLIPRPDTEVLIESVQATLAAAGGRSPRRLLDVGTGSGCIALALAKIFPESLIDAWDVSPAALAVAQLNAARLAVSTVSFSQCDVRQVESWQIATRFDILVANPPYVAPAERENLAVSVRDYEPATALFAERCGLEFYEILAAQAPQVLAADGQLFIEIGNTQAAAVTALLQAHSWRQVQVIKDYGRQDRVVKALAPLGALPA